ncbi:HAD family hydrolase [Butyrivibrio sp. VCD2006]|uniref:HAD family hydrolase n=1 Tax=Butyrivibrio sp. VCD2006 TaxID=1280664 RepID=UPI000415FCFA|nr:HAD family hydrolase [Butyrivibrio sp. VCD2006]
MKAVIFDMDGTILNSLEDLKNSINHALKENGLPERSLEEVRHFVGKGMVYLVNKAIPDGTPSNIEESVLESHKTYYPLHCADNTKPYPGICHLLAELKEAGIKTAVVSNKADENVKRLVEQYFDGLFTVSVGARDGVPRKPSRELVDIALVELGIDKHDAIYVGDSDIDVATAKNSELPMITVLWGFRTRDELVAAGADTEHFAETTEELKSFIFGM